MPTETNLDLRESIASIQVTKSLEEVLASAPADVQERVGKLLQEAESSGRDAGLVPLYVIRPGIGRGKGSHLYEADMLAKNADVFRNWKMYVDHLSEAARKALGGLPRSIRDLGGRVTEAWWDPTVPADEARGHGQGAVVGLSKPVPYVKELVDNDPELVEASISARATHVRPKNVGGQRVWVVEGIEPRGSVDWVTEAGAGGKVVSLIESYYEETEDMALLESLSDDDLLEHIQSERPELAALLAEADPDGDGDEDAGKVAARVKQLMKKGLNREMAEKAARREIGSGSKEAQEGDHNDDEEGDDVPVDVAALREAFASDEGKVLVDELLEGRVEELFEERLPAIIEEKLGEERELIMVEARADADRKIQLRDMRDEAHRIISEAKLPDEFAKVAKAKFDLTESGPTQELDVLDDLDDQGAIVKTAEEILAEAVAAEVEHQQRLLAAANPTRVRQPVAKATKKKDDEGNDIEEAEVESTGSPKTDALLLAAGHDPKSLNKVFG
jgi:hypothetical protein